MYDPRVPAVGRFAPPLARVVDRVADLVFPADCVGCGRPLSGEPRRGTLCTPCFAALPRLPRPACRRCAEPLGLPAAGDDLAGRGTLCLRCEGDPPRFGSLRSGGLFTGPLRDAIHAFKYRRHDFLAPHLAAFALGEPEVPPLLPPGSSLVPVPMHRAKRRERGYNPAELVAAELARATGGSVRRLLAKHRPTPSQSGLPLEERRRNVRDSLRIRRLPFSPPIPTRVVLVDDVATSGATLDECARLLRQAGVREVDAVTVARTPRESPPGAAAVPLGENRSPC